MRVLTFGLGLALALTLTSCGGGSPRSTGSKKKTENTASSTPALPAPPVPTKRPAPVQSAAGAKTEGSAPAADAPPAGPAAGAKDVLTTETIMPGGKSVGDWSTMLDSKDNAQVIEALDAVRLFHDHLGSLKPKVAALTKSTNADISKAATEALSKLK